MKVYYPATPASDGTSMTPPANAQFTVHELSDTTFSNPLPLETLAGTNAAPLTTTAQGVLPDVYVISDNYSHVFRSGDWKFRRDSFDGAQAATEAARAAAVRAAAAAGAPADTAVDAGIQRADLPGIVKREVSAQPAVTAAAAVAVNDEVARASLVRSVQALEDEAAGGFLDANGRLTFATFKSDGGPTDFSRNKLGVPLIAHDEVAGGVLDGASRQTDLVVGYDGHVTDRVMALWKARLGVGAGGSGGAVAQVGSSNRHAMLENELRMTYGGTVRTNGAAPVVFICDHGLNNFKNIVHPLLAARGLTAVLALNSNLHKPGHNIEWESANVTWAEVNAWPYEVANHSMEHTNNPVAEKDLEADIVGSLTELRTLLPGKKILNWVQPSIAYPDFNNGRYTANWTDTTAGRLIYENHAVATGTMSSPTHPLYARDGNPLQGVVGVWIDGRDSTTAIKQQIRDATAAGKGIIIRHHPRNIDASDTMITTAELTSFLDFLKTEQDAARIKVMNLSQWSIADTGK